MDHIARMLLGRSGSLRANPDVVKMREADSAYDAQAAVNEMTMR
jgi:hypothetical protein